MLYISRRRNKQFSQKNAPNIQAADRPTHAEAPSIEGL